MRAACAALVVADAAARVARRVVRQSAFAVDNAAAPAVRFIAASAARRATSGFAGIAIWVASAAKAPGGHAGAVFIRKRNRGWRKGGSTEALPLAAVGTDRFCEVRTVPRSVTSTEQERIGVVVYVRMD